MAAAPALLTPRQLEVLELMAKGLTNKEIGGVLAISPGTAKVHVAAIIQALDVTNRTEATNRLHELGLGTRDDEPGREFTVPGFGSRPAIAVLPFDNFSSDPKQGFLADGIVEDLITSLASWRWFPVIARNSTFAYKGQAVDVKAVAHALGAGFVVEGSVRAAGDRLRITVQVLDGATAAHVWAEKYDRDLADVFDVTDEIVASIVASLEPALLRVGGLRVLTHRTDQLDAWEHTQRAYVHAAENRLQGFLDAQACIDRATRIDPNLTLAWAISGYCQFNLFALGHRDADADPATRLARNAEVLAQHAPNDPFASIGLGLSLLVQKDREGALRAMRRAVELGPSLIYALHGIAMAEEVNGHHEESLAWLDRLFRLSPQDPLVAVTQLHRGLSLSALGRLDEAEEAYRTALMATPELPFPLVGLATLHALRGDDEQARALVARIHEIQPGFSPLPTLQVMLAPEYLEAARSLLARIGMDVEPQA